MFYVYCGEVAEWLKALVPKTGKAAMLSRVRISPSPPRLINLNIWPLPAGRQGVVEGGALEKRYTGFRYQRFESSRFRQHEYGSAHIRRPPRECRGESRPHRHGSTPAYAGQAGTHYLMIYITIE